MNFVAYGHKGEQVDNDYRDRSKLARHITSTAACQPRRPGQRGDGDEISRHAGVEDKSRSDEVINKDHSANAQQQRAYCKPGEEVGLDPVGDPQQDGSLDEPTNGDPVLFEANGNGDGDEHNGKCEMQQSEPVERLRAGP